MIQFCPTLSNMNTAETTVWLTAKQVTEKAQLHHETVLLALRRRLLKGTQSCTKGHWRIRESDFDDWMERGAPATAGRRRTAA